jgi:hypothetical protein
MLAQRTLASISAKKTLWRALLPPQIDAGAASTVGLCLAGRTAHAQGSSIGTR